MRHVIPCVGLALLIACSGQAPKQAAPEEQAEVPQPSNPPVADVDEPNDAAPIGVSAPVWESIASGEGTALRLTGGDGALRISIGCLGDPARLTVNVPAFEAVMSEDRFAFGVGPEPVTLVADPYRQEARPGVTGEGPAPDDFAGLLDNADEVRALYGYQKTGPFAAPPPELKALLIEACAEP